MEKMKIEDVCTFVGGSQPEKSKFIYEPKDGYIRLIQTRDYKTDRFMTYIPEEDAKKQCNKSDVMIGRYGPPIFQILRGLEGAYNVALMKAVPKENILNDYLYYLLKQKNLFLYIDALSSRTGGQTGVDIDSLYKYPVLLPEKEYQKKVVDLLKGIDDKIELNNKLRDNIEKMLWQAWIHDTNIKGKEYKMRPLSYLCDVINDSINPYEMPDKEFNYYTIPDFDSTGTYVSELGGNIKSNKNKVANNDILVSKLNPWFRRVVLVNCDAISSTEFVAFRAQNIAYRNFLYALFISEPFRTFASTNATGTSNSHKRIDPEIMKDFKIRMNLDVIKEYGEWADIYVRKIINIVDQNYSLSKTRDFLLPMLMSGQIKIA